MSARIKPLKDVMAISPITAVIGLTADGKVVRITANDFAKQLLSTVLNPLFYGGDLNDLTAGIYYTTASTLNTPTSYGIVIHILRSGNAIQVFFGTTPGDVYTRYYDCQGGSWAQWARVQ